MHISTYANFKNLLNIRCTLADIPLQVPLTVWDQAGQMLYCVRYPGLTTTHSVRSGRPDTLPTELSQLDDHSQYEIRQARCSTDRAILAQPLLTVWDQAGWTLYWLNYPSLATTHSMRSGRPDALPTELYQLICHSQCEIRQARCSTDWATPAWLLLSLRSGRPDAVLTELSQLGHHSQCEIRQAWHSTDWTIPAWPPLTVWDQAGQMLYWPSYPGSATAHSVRSGRLDTLLTELSQLCHHSQYEIRQAQCSTDWAIPAHLPLTVWDQAGQMLYQLSYPSLAATQFEIRQARCCTNWAIPAWPPLTVWDEAGLTLYWLNYPSLTTTHSMRSGRPDALLTELSWLSHCSQCEIRQAGHSTDWTIPALPPLTVWDQAGPMLYRLSYTSSSATHSVRSGRPDALPTELPQLGCHSVWDQAGQMLY